MMAAFSHPHDGLRGELDVAGSFGGAKVVLLLPPPSCNFGLELYAPDGVFVLICPS
jgi:hypothetical protein